LGGKGQVQEKKRTFRPEKKPKGELLLQDGKIKRKDWGGGRGRKKKNISDKGKTAH